MGQKRIRIRNKIRKNWGSREKINTMRCMAVVSIVILLLTGCSQREYDATQGSMMMEEENGESQGSVQSEIEDGAKNHNGESLKTNTDSAGADMKAADGVAEARADDKGSNGTVNAAGNSADVWGDTSDANGRAADADADVLEGGTEQMEEIVKQQILIVENPRVNFMKSPQGIDSMPLWFSWEPPFLQAAYELVIEKDGTPLWSSGKIESNQTVNVPYDGRDLDSYCSYQYYISAYDELGNMARSETASFSTACLEGDIFSDDAFICLPDGMKANGEGQGVYGKAFELPEGEIEKAWFFGSALGIYEAWINGEPIGDYLWKPGWTDYRKTLLYNTFDITEYVKQGQINYLTSMVNDGWWTGDNAFGTYGTHKPAFICEVLVRYVDGSEYRMGTDDSWRCGTDVNIRYADFFQGETCDLRLPAATEAVLETPVGLSTIFKGKFKSAWMEGVRTHEDRTLSPISGYVYEGAVLDGTTFGAVNRVTDQAAFPLTLQPGQTLLVDLGQNIAGIPEIAFDAGEGTQINLQFAEMLNDRGERSAGNDGPAGSLYRENYRAAKTEVKVIASGKKGKEIFRPTFFFTGFRYMTVEVSAETVIHDLRGIGTGNASPENGSIVTDNAKLNRLFENVKWSQRNNFTMIATDCPQRDERLGWMGDLQSFSTTSMYNQDLYSFYRKWEQDLVDAQRGSGAYTDTAPSTANTGAGNAGWAEAGILVPWNVYRMYGNTEQLVFLYDSMKKYMEYLEQKSNFADGPIGGGIAYGDWLSKEGTDKHFLAALWYGEDALVMQKIAGILGKEDDAKSYETLFYRITDFIKKHYLGQPGKLSQTEMCFLLKYRFLDVSDVVIAENAVVTNDQETLENNPESLEAEQAGQAETGQNLKEQVEQLLQESVEKHEHLLMTGFAGTPVLLQILTDLGRSDMAYRVLTAEGNPSWLYSVNQGATTIWERYDSYTLEKGFASAAMNSFDHFNEGSVAQWMYESMVGISVDMARENPILIKPYLPPEDVELHEVNGSFHSVYGEVTVSWKLLGEKVQVDVTIPMGAKANVVLPIAGEKEQLLPGGTYHFEGKRT